jgi:hypothetical protein
MGVAYFNIKEVCILPTDHTYASRKILKINSACFP